MRSGHPWVYADRIKDENRAGEPGEIAIVYDRSDRFLALALYDPHSPIRLRVLHTGKPTTIDGEWWRAHMRRAMEERNFDESTTGFRWINGESDGWPGLIMDRYGDTVVLKLYSVAWLPLLDQIRAWIFDCCEPVPMRIVLRLSRNIADLALQKFSRKDGDMLFGPKPTAPVEFLECGLRFEADVVRGQKTGFFLDQRENRKRVAEFAKGADVLNVFSHAGGFSVHAAAAGAHSAADLDISPHALESARRNMALNSSLRGVDACHHDTIQADAFAWLEATDRRRFDIVIIDPPSMAKRQSEVPAALAAYSRLATAGLRRLNKGGMLVAASCSAHVSEGDFFQTIRQCVVRNRRGFREIATIRHASDHPARIPEAHYLKCMITRILG